MKKPYLWILIAIISINSSVLFADDDNPGYVHFKDYPTPHGSTDVAPGTPTYTYPEYFTFKDFPNPQGGPAISAYDLGWHPRPNPIPSCPPKT